MDIALSAQPSPQPPPGPAAQENRGSKGKCKNGGKGGKAKKNGKQPPQNNQPGKQKQNKNKRTNKKQKQQQQQQREEESPVFQAHSLSPVSQPKEEQEQAPLGNTKPRLIFTNEEDGPAVYKCTPEGTEKRYYLCTECLTTTEMRYCSGRTEQTWTMCQAHKDKETNQPSERSSDGDGDGALQAWRKLALSGKLLDPTVFDYQSSSSSAAAAAAAVEEPPTSPSNDSSINAGNDIIIPDEYPHRIVKYKHDEQQGCEHCAHQQRIVDDKLIEDVQDEQDVKWPAQWYKLGLSEQAEARAMMMAAAAASKKAHRRRDDGQKMKKQKKKKKKQKKKTKQSDHGDTLKALSLGAMPPFKVIKTTYMRKCNGQYVNLLGEVWDVDSFLARKMAKAEKLREAAAATDKEKDEEKEMKMEMEMEMDNGTTSSSINSSSSSSSRRSPLSSPSVFSDSGKSESESFHAASDEDEEEEQVVEKTRSSDDDVKDGARFPLRNLLAREQLLYRGIIDDQDFIMTCWAWALAAQQSRTR